LQQSHQQLQGIVKESYLNLAILLIHS